MPRPPSNARPLLVRILETPHIARIIPRLQPDILHGVIQACGLEDCGDLVAMASVSQLRQIFDRDLWHPAGPGRDERLDADRFAVWLDVLMEAGAPAAAQKIAALPLDLIVTALAQHVRVFDLAAIAPVQGDDEMLFEDRHSEHVSAEVGGYRIEFVRSSGCDTILHLLVELETENPARFHALMRGCRLLSDSGAEPDGFHDVLSRREQDMFDLAATREDRRAKQGYVTAAQARAFLQRARVVNRTDATPPRRDPVAAACLRTLERADVTRAEEHSDAPTASAVTRGVTGAPTVDDDAPRAFEIVIDLLREAGVVAPPRALIGSGRDEGSVALLQAHVQFAFERDPQVYSTRIEELAFLANALLAGCAVQGRPFTPAEASDAAAAICNLGLENWPAHWRTHVPHASSVSPAGSRIPEAFLVHQDLVGVFQVGWSALYRQVSMYAAEQLTGVLTRIDCADRDIQVGLAVLRRELSRYLRDGAPWHASTALDAIMPLDMAAWAALLALIAECPVLHAAIATARLAAPRTIDASAFELISTNAQIDEIRAFLASLPGRLAS